MNDASKPEITFLICKVAGFGLMLAFWFYESELVGFFLLLFLVMMSLLRWRFPKFSPTVMLDALACALLSTYWGYAHYALILVIFEGMYRRFFWISFAGMYFLQLAGVASFQVVEYVNLHLILLVILGMLCGFFLGEWERECASKHSLRDVEARKLHELEHQQSDMMTTLPKIERMTAVSERARIARDIHDNAGHEIVAAYISLQTMRKLFDTEDRETLELYDAALERLQRGVDKIRETAHNLQTVTSIGVEILLEICQKFPDCPVDFRTYGDTSRIPVYVWNVLEACLNESLTNVTRHARASYVSVELDATQHLVRLCIENDGTIKPGGKVGSGLRNLRHRAISIGGSLTVDADKKFRLVCVIPIQEESNETIDC